MTSGPIVVGVQLNQPDAVVQQAAQVAGLLGTDLVCAHVDAEVLFARGLTGSAAAFGGGIYLPVDPDVDEPEAREFDPALRDQIAAALSSGTVAWRTEYLAGEPAAALGGLAERLDAPMIVVGTREAGVGRTMHDFFTGSAAVHLAHRQHRPVLVIPTHPVTSPDELPWSSGNEASSHREETSLAPPAAGSADASGKLERADS